MMYKLRYKCLTGNCVTTQYLGYDEAIKQINHLLYKMYTDEVRLYKDELLLGVYTRSSVILGVR